MNKTITINLAGINFYIDEDAYRRLDHYLKAISKSLDFESRKETLADIEARIAEIFIEDRHGEDKVVDLSGVEKMIKIMGQPEDYKVGEEETNSTASSRPHKGSKKLYRDIEHRNIGGVCAGLATYMGISRIWVRIIFLLLLFPGLLGHLFLSSGSTIFLVYIILWIVMPAARTTSQKLEMHGENIDVDTIERKVKEEYHKVKNKVRDTKASGLEHFLEVAGNILVAIFKIISVVIGALIVLGAGFGLISLFFHLLIPGAIHFSLSGLFGSIPFFFSQIPQGLHPLLVLLLAGIPLFLLFLAGLKIISPPSNSIGLTAVLVLIGIWVLSLIFTIFYHPGWHLRTPGYYLQVKKENLPVANRDTLYISGLPLFQKNEDAEDTLKEEMTLTHTDEVSISLKSTSEKPRIRIKKILKAPQDISQARPLMVYSHKISNDTLYLARQGRVGRKAVGVRHFRVTIRVLIPENMIFKVNENSPPLNNISPDQRQHYLKFKSGHLIKLPDAKNQSPRKQHEE